MITIQYPRHVTMTGTGQVELKLLFGAEVNTPEQGTCQIDTSLPFDEAAQHINTFFSDKFTIEDAPETRTFIVRDYEA